MRKREVLGLIFLVVGAVGVYISVRLTPPQYVYLTAGRDISPGEVIASDDFVRESLFLSTAGNKYVTGDFILAGHRALRKIARGEIIPRGALTSEREMEERHLVTFTIPTSHIPEKLQAGNLIDIYFFTVKNQGALDEKFELAKVLSKARIQSIQSKDGQLDGQVTISVLVDQKESGEIISLITNSRLAIAQRFDDNE
jgi:hypothetical protein